MFFDKVGEVLDLVINFIYRSNDILSLIINDIQIKISQMSWINIIGYCLIIIISILIGGKIMRKVLSLISNIFRKFTLETALLFSIIGYYMTTNGFKYMLPTANLIIGCFLQIISIIWLSIMTIKIGIIIKKRLSNKDKIKEEKSEILHEEDDGEEILKNVELK